ncbi:MAG: DsbA family oxidoreductase [Pseudomonadota bacterium]
MSEIISSSIALSGDRQLPEAALQVEVIADFVCPYSYIGKRRLDRALTAVGGPAEVSWYPFQLNPDMPAEGMPFDAYLASRFGARSAVQPVLDSLTAEGREEGIDFRFQRLERVPNTTMAHQLMYLVEREGGSQTALAERLFAAYFEHGLDTGNPDVLETIGRAEGLSREQLRNLKSDEKTRQFVQSRESQVRASGLTGVPGFLLNRRLLVVGAQPTETLVTAFDRAMFGEGNDALVSPALN